MGATEITTFAQIVEKFVLPVAMFIVFVVGLHREWWVMGRTYKDAVAREKESKEEIRTRLEKSENEWRTMFKELEDELRSLTRAYVKNRPTDPSLGAR